MKLNIAPYGAVAIIGLLGAAGCAPISPQPETNRTSPSMTSSRSLHKRINDCFDSYFINQSSDSSPTVADCMTLADNIVGPGTWIVNPLTQRTLAKFGTCAFGIKNTSNRGIYVGNDDIRDLIWDSIRRFSYHGTGVMQAKGGMYCQSFLIGSQFVTWGIYHT